MQNNLPTVFCAIKIEFSIVLIIVSVLGSVLGQIKGHVDDVLQRKNTEARTYQSEIARLQVHECFHKFKNESSMCLNLNILNQAMQEQLNEFAKRKLQEYGLTIAELGYEPVRPGDMTGTARLKVPLINIIV